MKDYNAIDDNELLYMVGENREDASEWLLKKYTKLIEIKSNKYKKFVKANGYEYADLIQEVKLFFLKSIDGFNKYKNTSFKTYCNLVIDRGIGNFIRNISRDKHKFLNNSVSLDYEDDYTKPVKNYVSNSTNDILNKEEMIDFYDNIFKDLPEEYKQIIYLKTHGYTVREISEELQLSINKVSRAILKIRNKIKELKYIE